MRQLAKQGAEWQWGDSKREAFLSAKAMVKTEAVFRYYRPEVGLTIHCDASDKGRGAALLQYGQPRAYGSRALTETEGRCANSEKEMLAVVLPVEKYHQYTFGRHTAVYSDHKPLERIMTKPQKDVPKRLQNMRMRLQQCDVTVVYKPGEDQYLADTLNRSNHRATDEIPPKHNDVNRFISNLTDVNLTPHLTYPFRAQWPIRPKCISSSSLCQLLHVWLRPSSSTPVCVFHFQ